MLAEAIDEDGFGEEEAAAEHSQGRKIFLLDNIGAICSFIEYPHQRFLEVRFGPFLAQGRVLSFLFLLSLVDDIAPPAKLLNGDRSIDYALIDFHLEQAVKEGIWYGLLEAVNGRRVEIVLNAECLRILKIDIAINEQQLVELLTVGAPNQLELLGEVMLEVEAYLAAPAVIASLLEGLKKEQHYVGDVVFFRSEKLGFLARHGGQDDCVALFEVEVDVGGWLKSGEVLCMFLGLAEQSAHPT